jgi:5-methyltetrahydropteroyltriglutamate--homocysteine methyltransferase
MKLSETQGKTQMQTARQIIPTLSLSVPPFRAEQVGSLLRPDYLLEARGKFDRGESGVAELRKVEDNAIREVVRKQEELGFQGISDGELRRAYFHLDFLKKFEGITVTGNIAANSDAGESVGFTPPKISVTGKLRHLNPIQVEDFKTLQCFTDRTPKVTIPSPTMVHFRGGRSAISKEAYPDMEEFFEDLAKCFREEIEALYTAGCRYIQLDDTNLAYLCDPKMCEDARKRGEDTDKLPHTYADLINAAIRHDHDDLHIGIHLCRGNFRSEWFSEGSYDPVAEVLFNELDIDTYFLEYDDSRSGGFAPLRFVPEHKKVVLGLISSKHPDLEGKQQIISRIQEAASYIPLDNLCLSPQCGFASTHHGNAITAEQQWAKLALVQEIAGEVW